MHLGCVKFINVNVRGAMNCATTNGFLLQITMPSKSGGQSPPTRENVINVKTIHTITALRTLLSMSVYNILNNSRKI